MIQHPIYQPQYWPPRVQILVGLVGVALIAFGIYMSRRNGK